MTATQSNTQVFNLFDWTKGVHDQASNPLLTMNASLFAGENIDITNTGLEVRNGVSTFSTLPTPDPIVHLSSLMFPTNRANYLLAQLLQQGGGGFAGSGIYFARGVADRYYHKNGRTHAGSGQGKNPQSGWASGNDVHFSECPYVCRPGS